MIKSLTEAKIQLSTLVASGDTTYITNKGTPSAVLLPYSEYREMYRFWRQAQDQQAIEEATQFLKGEGPSYADDELDALLAKA